MTLKVCDICHFAETLIGITSGSLGGRHKVDHHHARLLPPMRLGANPSAAKEGVGLLLSGCSSSLRCAILPHQAQLTCPHGSGWWLLRGSPQNRGDGCKVHTLPPGWEVHHLTCTLSPQLHLCKMMGARASSVVPKPTRASEQEEINTHAGLWFGCGGGLWMGWSLIPLFSDDLFALRQWVDLQQWLFSTPSVYRAGKKFSHLWNNLHEKTYQGI